MAGMKYEENFDQLGILRDLLIPDGLGLAKTEQVV